MRRKKKIGSVCAKEKKGEHTALYKISNKSNTNSDISAHEHNLYVMGHFGPIAFMSSFFSLCKEYGSASDLR